MRKSSLFLLPFLFLIIFSNHSFAQRYIGVGASYSTSLQAMGIQLKYNTSFSSKLGSSVEYENFFLSGENKWQTVGLHFSYNLVENDKFKFYILGGGQFLIFESEDVLVSSGDTYNGTTYSTDFTISGSKASDIGGRLGVGMNKFFGEHLLCFVETKITFNPRVDDITTFSNLSTNQIIPTVGLAYHF